LHGIRLDLGTGSADRASLRRVWKREDTGTFVPSPAEYRGRIYLVRDRGEVECLDPATGKTIWTGAFPKDRSNYYASPMIAGGNLYAAREDGAFFIARIENDFQLLSENHMGESVIATPIPASDRLLIRGDKHLFCVGPRP
jgi:outer membrane protein assembly factor BamB